MSGMTSLGRRMPAHGPVAERWRLHQERSRKVVFRRCKGICEVPECGAQATDWMHLFGRRHIVEEPYASSPELTAGGCRTHHNDIDRGIDPKLRDRLRLTALQRFALAHRVGGSPWPPEDLIGRLREMVAMIEGND